MSEPMNVHGANQSQGVPGLLREDYILNGHPVSVIHLWHEPVECAMCDTSGDHRHAVPWYCGPVAEGQSDGGYKAVCQPCHDKWAAWNASVRSQK